MKICLGQINTTPGDFDGNLKAMLTGIDEANANGADIIVFPELTVPGYLSQDLIYQKDFIDRNLAVVETLIGYTKQIRPELHIVFGYIDRNDGLGKPFFNQAMVAAAGVEVASYKKHLLPFYDVFDELRYFEPGTELCCFELQGQKIGITICEDLWNDKGSDDYHYAANPFQRYREQNVDLILSLNSSPYIEDKPWQRISTIAPGIDDGLSLVYVNQIGGQDELVFDGGSFVIRDGDLLHIENNITKNTYPVVELTFAKPVLEKPHRIENKSIFMQSVPSQYELLVLCLKDYVKKSGFSQLVLASSGGVDSAVVCQMACDAIGAKNVHAIRMPSVFSSEHSKDDAVLLHKNLGCWDYEVPIDHMPLVDELNTHYFAFQGESENLVTQKLKQGYSSVADENIQARMRDLYIMHFSNAFGAMPLSTGNKTESACGYYTHFDMNFSFAPIKDLYKYQVMDIAKSHPAIPENIWRKPPSAELAEGQTDEANLLPYAVLDAIVRAYVEDYVSNFFAFKEWVIQCDALTFQVSMDKERLSAWLDEVSSESEFKRIVGLIGRMEYKRRQTCPGTKVSKVAFGIGRRFPIVDKWS